jgi:hypothetical protein
MAQHTNTAQPHASKQIAPYPTCECGPTARIASIRIPRECDADLTSFPPALSLKAQTQAAERSPVPHTMRSAVRLLCSILFRARKLFPIRSAAGHVSTKSGRMSPVLRGPSTTGLAGSVSRFGATTSRCCASSGPLVSNAQSKPVGASGGLRFSAAKWNADADRSSARTAKPSLGRAA